MCGVFCSVCISKENFETFQNYYNTVKELLDHRGPDSTKELCLEHLGMVFAGHVLWQQGKSYSEQPVYNNNHYLLFNGDIYSDRADLSKSDTEWLFEEIIKCQEESSLIDFFKDLRGPFSIIYYNTTRRILYVLRDSLGRNSLLISNQLNGLVFSSSFDASIGHNSVMELPPIGIYKFSFNTQQNNFNLEICTWNNIKDHYIYDQQWNKLESFLNVQIHIADNIKPNWLASSIVNNNKFNFIELREKISGMTNSKFYDKLLENYEIKETSLKIISLLSRSVEERIMHTPEYCKNCLKLFLTKNRTNTENGCDHPKIGILFSGGIDCSILAVLADKFIDKHIPIDLLNVAFEKFSTNKKECENINYNVPDRETAKKTLEELKNICPERIWNLVEINITRKELDELLASHIKNLIFPLSNILDESLGAAFWFAARGNGVVNGVTYQSSARVLLVGTGADELFGGYTRHRNAYIRQKCPIEQIKCLDEELLLDWVRLPYRNLARDDRIICDHGVTPRAAYLEENLINYVSNLASVQKCNFEFEHGVGDKMLLRLCGYLLNLKETCFIKKRAFQFGSRIANNKQNAKDISKILSK